MCKRILLIVDDEQIMRRSLVRMLRSLFDEVFAASECDQAQEILKRHTVTHIICDNNLGVDVPKGIELLPVWRKQFISIKYAVLFTGDDIANIPQVEGIDSMLSKIVPASEIVDSLAP